MLMAYEVTRDMPTQLIEIETPLATMTQPGDRRPQDRCSSSILRAGTGFLDGMLEVIPGARVGHVGLYRDPKTLVAVEYYFKMPHGMNERDAIVLDPMLATGNSAVAAVDRLKETRPKSIHFVCLLAAPEGIANFHSHHPDVPIYTAAIDRAAQRPRLHRAGPRRRRRPHLRHQVSAICSLPTPRCPTAGAASTCWRATGASSRSAPRCMRPKAPSASTHKAGS